MSVSLSDYVASLRREVTPPGSSSFATVSDEQMTGYLADAFWEAFLDGFLQGYDCDVTGVITARDATGPDIPRQDIALVVLYAGIKILRNKLLETNTRFKAVAGPVQFEQENSANLLTEMLKQLQAIKDRLLAVEFQVTPTFLIDGYSVRQSFIESYAGVDLGYLDWVGSTLAEIGA